MSETNLIDHFTGDDNVSQPLLELKLGEQPALVQLFTPSAPSARLHWIADDAANGYVVCPGRGCPVCYAGKPPKLTWLLPVVDVETGLVKVVRVPDDRKPGALASKLLTHLKDPAIKDKVLLLSRVNFTYCVEARPAADAMPSTLAAIQQFQDRVEAGLQIESAFRHMTAEELAEVPSIANRLVAIGGWSPPRNERGDAAGAEAAEAS